jgi:hypothetical protein
VIIEVETTEGRRRFSNVKSYTFASFVDALNEPTQVTIEYWDENGARVRTELEATRITQTDEDGPRRIFPRN